MDKVKIRNIKTGAVEEVKKEIAGDFIGTREWVLEESKQQSKEEPKKDIFNKEDK